MSNIKLYPIFNQSIPGIWDDLLHIRIITMRESYNIKMSDADIVRAMNEFQNSWRRLSFNFAFGAYDDNKMIGCVSGDVQQRVGYIRHLYVLPEYQGKHIGLRLLNAAQVASSIMANKTDVVSLPGAEPFYRAQGYRSPVGTNAYIKPIGQPRCQTVPIFHCTPSIARKCNTMCTDRDSAPLSEKINTDRVPAFAYYDIESRITACGIIAPDGRRHIYSVSNHPDNWAGRCIARGLDAYILQNTK